MVDIINKENVRKQSINKYFKMKIFRNHIALRYLAIVTKNRLGSI
jgi:hypothetical protein